MVIHNELTKDKDLDGYSGVVGKTRLAALIYVWGDPTQISLEGFAFFVFFARSLLQASFQRSRTKKPWLSPRLICVVGKTRFELATPSTPC